MNTKARLTTFGLASLLVAACSSSSSSSISATADSGIDGSKDGGFIAVEAGIDSATDAGMDSATPIDATVPTDAAPEAGLDAGPVTAQRLLNPVDKMDLVLVVDNSAGMADKQYILSLVIPDLVQGLVNPRCLDDATNAPITSGQPQDPLTACPTGSSREFPPIEDMHIGILSSSLGTFGADGCPDRPPASCSGTPSSTSNDDHGHLITRTDPCGTTNVPTYQSLGFLAWDPAQKLSPPGTSTVADLSTALTSLAIGDGEVGCGFESQNEAWYRFLVDPTPYQSIALSNNQVVVNGTDATLLDQRKAFLRPDSLLAIVVVSDETDTSIKEYSSYPLMAAPELHLPHPSSGCGFGTATPTPKDPCCYSCGQAVPSGCTADPACASSPSYSSADEDTSLRAFGLISHKSRYGIEFFYPPSRYVTALTGATVSDVNGVTVPNPIFANLDPTNYPGVVRDPGLVYYGAIVGVPWQLLARQTSGGTPDLVNGVSALDATAVGGFKTSTELALTDTHGNVFWDDIAGDPESYVAALSPFMQESTSPRSGTDPITGAAISPTTTANGSGSQVGGGLLNDHERTLKTPPNDIEYACVFDLPAGHTKDCTTGVECDCPSTPTATDNPLCNGTTQIKDKAYPGIKHLAIARGMGAQGVAASICPKQLTDSTAADYAYRPAMRAIVDGVKAPMHRECMARSIPHDASNQVACTVVEASHTATNACTCDSSKGFAQVSSAHMAIETAVEADPLNTSAQWNCFCEVEQLAGSQLADCQTNESTGSSENGWCYVDGTIGSAEQTLVDRCPAGEQHEIRLVGAAQVSAGASVFVSCAGE